VSDSWVPKPPAPCHRTGKDEVTGGPYFVEKVLVAEVVAGPSGPQVRPRIRPIVHAASWIKTICDSPGSPFKALTADEIAVYENAVAERNDMALKIEELEQEIEARKSLDGLIDTNALVVSLEQHFARKTGPKKVA
jgi:hypothetical protein